MKKIYCFLLMQLIASLAFAQKHEPGNPHKDKKDIGGFTVRLKPTTGNYRFDILKNNQPLPGRRHDFDAIMPQGFEKKDDAFKVAEWMIKEHKKTGHFPAMLPPHVAKQLKINTHPKPSKHN